MKAKYIWTVYPVLILLIFFGYKFYKNRQYNRDFFKKPVHSIIERRDNWQLRATSFYLNDGTRIDSSAMEKIDLHVGDSIDKKSNSLSYNVYRIDESGIFKPVATYTIKE